MQNTTAQSEKHRVVIVGAGFAGLWAARHLSRGKAKRRIDVTLIDRNNYHTFYPLLYQVAAAELDPTSIAYPLRGIFRDAHNVRTVMSEVTEIDVKNKLVVTQGGNFAYDQLVLAPGSRTAYYGVTGAEEYCFGLKSLEEAIQLRNHILACFERASLEGENIPEGLLTFAVVGAGATGLEFAGALAELIAMPLRRDFPRLRQKAEVLLIDGAENVLMPFSPLQRDYARAKLEKMGVTILTGAGVKEVSPGALTLSDGRSIRSCTIVWSAGVHGEAIGKTEGLVTGRGDRVAVTPTLQVAGKPEIHVAGDISLPAGKNPPMVAPNAIQQGTHVAKNILLYAQGEATQEFIYRDKGSMVTIGRNAAVVQLGKRSFTGFPAWVLWLFVHLAYLIGFRNRLLVLVNWAWDYLFFERAVRLIVPGVRTVLEVCGTKNACKDESGMT